MKRKSSPSRASRPHRTAEERADILNEQQRSGLSLLAFAQTRGLCYASLRRWRSRQRDEASSGVRSESEEDPRFVPVKIESEGWGGDYVLSWVGGRSLKIPRHFETASLRRLLRVLEGVR